jgi:hypothetical protein
MAGYWDSFTTMTMDAANSSGTALTRTAMFIIVTKEQTNKQTNKETNKQTP